MQLTSGSTGSPKAVQISHRNVVSNAEAMFVGADVDVDSDVIVSWLPCFHDMGMTGYLTVPMYFGVELVKVTPMDFLRDTLLWARLIDKYQGTMTAAPNFAYTMFAKRLRRQAQPGQFDLSSLRWALSGAEQVDPADVEDLCEAAAPFGLRPEAVVPAYGMAETTVAVSFTECGRGLTVDEVDADLLAMLHRAVPATRGKTRRLASLGSPLKGLEVQIVDQDGAVHACPQRRRDPGARRTGDAGVHHDGRFHLRAKSTLGWYDTGDLGYLTETGDVVVCGRVKDVIIMAGRNIYPTDIERAAARVARGPARLCGGGAPEGGPPAGDVRGGGRGQLLGRPGRGAPRRAAGGPRGVRRGRRPAPQRRRARAGHDSENAVGKTAPRPRDGTGHLNLWPSDVRVRRPARSHTTAADRSVHLPAGSGRSRPARRRCAACPSMVAGARGVFDLLGDVAGFAAQAIPGVDGAGVALIDASKGHPTLQTTTSATAEFVHRIDAVQYDELHEGPCITCMETGRPAVSGSLGGDGRWPRFGGRVARMGVHSALSMPLVVGERA